MTNANTGADERAMLWEGIPEDVVPMIEPYLPAAPLDWKRQMVDPLARLIASIDRDRARLQQVPLDLAEATALLLERQAAAETAAAAWDAGVKGATFADVLGARERVATTEARIRALRAEGDAVAEQLANNRYELRRGLQEDLPFKKRMLQQQYEAHVERERLNEARAARAAEAARIAAAKSAAEAAREDQRRRTVAALDDLLGTTPRPTN